MKKQFLIAVLFAAAASTSAFAGNNDNDVINNYDQRNYGGNTTNAGGLGGQGGAGGAGGSASAGAAALAGAVATGGNSNATGGASNATGGSVFGSGNSSNSNKIDNKNTNTNAQGQQQGQAQGQQQSSNSTSGVKNSGNSASNSGGNSISNNIQGDTVERSAPAVSIAAPYQPITSCRLSVMGGGSNTNGAFAGGIPIGNDQTCLSGVALQMMERAGGFSAKDKQTVVCRVEGMSELDTCKALGKSKAAVAFDVRPMASAQEYDWNKPTLAAK